MMIPLIFIAVFVGVAALVGGVALMLRRDPEEAVADRLQAFARNSPNRSGGGKGGQQTDLLAGSLEDMPGMLELLFARFTNLRALLDQAGVSISPTQFLLAILGLGGVGMILPLIMRSPIAAAPILGLTLATFPLLWLYLKRRRRLAAFAKQLPASLELIARALRAGHSLAAAFHLVGEEVSDPLGSEFARVFEEQNLGVALPEALESLTVRVPNLDLRFFATAVVLQRQTGGDLAEILDKIGSLVRERFKLQGQIQALTGEGRLSGIILLGLPPMIFAAMLKLNSEYVMLLFTDPLGKRMLAGALVMQLLGALVIRKIINIKV
jgi:tight adherence protein B